MTGSRRLLTVMTLAVAAGAARPARAETPAPVPIDLATTLRLAGAQDLDVQIARERLKEARGRATSALLQFLPWLAPQAAYRRHGGLIQDVVGNVVGADKESYGVGVGAELQLDVGEAVFRTLAARQAVQASAGRLEGERQDALLRAAGAYFDLLEAQAVAAAARDALAISKDYEAQLQRAVEAGIALTADALRVRVQSQRYELALERAREEQRVRAARLAEVLRLDPAVELLANDVELAPVAVAPTSETLDALVAEALVQRPELREGDSLLRLAQGNEKASLIGPLVPSVGAQAFFGGLGGARLGETSSFGASRDYLATVYWRIGTGGLFDLGRMRTTRARREAARLDLERLRNSVARQVVEARTRVLSAEQQLQTARQALQTAEEALRQTTARRDLEVAGVLESILSGQDQARAREDYVRVLAAYDRAQYALLRALGRLGTSTAPW